MRTLLLSLALTACSSPRNLVCERVAILSPKAICQPELSGAGPASAHTARVTLESEPGKKVTVACGLTAGALAMVCDELQAQPKPEAPKP